MRLVAALLLLFQWASNGQNSTKITPQWRQEFEAAKALLESGYPEQAEPVFRRMISELPRSGPDFRRATLLSHFAFALTQMRKLPEAARQNLLARDEFQSLGPEYRTEVLILTVDSGRIEELQGKPGAAAVKYKQAEAFIADLPKPISLRVVDALMTVGHFRMSCGELDKAENLYQQMAGLSGDSVPGALAYALNGQAAVMAVKQRYPEAARLCREALLAGRPHLAPDDPAILTAHILLGESLIGMKRHNEAEQEFETVGGLLDASSSADPLPRITMERGLARIRHHQKRWEEASALYVRVIDYLERTTSPIDRTLLVTKALYANLLRDAKKGKEAKRIEGEVKQALVQLWILNPAAQTITWENLTR